MNQYINNRSVQSASVIKWLKQEIRHIKLLQITVQISTLFKKTLYKTWSHFQNLQWQIYFCNEFAMVHIFEIFLAHYFTVFFFTALL